MAKAKDTELLDTEFEPSSFDVDENDIASKPPKQVASKLDVIIYRPGPHDPSSTRVGPYTFHANVPKEFERTATIAQLLTQRREHDDGRITSEGVEARVRIAKVLAANPSFEINGVRAKGPKQIDRKLPATPEQYKQWARDWIMDADDPNAMDAQWDTEEHLRRLCNVTDLDVTTVRMFFEAKHAQCEGNAHIDVPRIRG